MAHLGCRICRESPKLIEEIEELIHGRFPIREIARNYLDVFGIDLHLLEQSIGTHAKKHLSRRLTPEEKELLERAERGEASLEEMANMVQLKAFENMIRNPEKLKFSDYLKLEKLKTMSERTRQKRFNSWGI